MKTEFFNIFTDKQIAVIKQVVKSGYWGDCDMEFGTKQTPNYAHGFTTNMGRDKSFSGFMSGISKKITSSGTEAIKMCNDWWQDGSGDMMFFNMDLLECNHNELSEWANN